MKSNSLNFKNHLISDEKWSRLRSRRSPHIEEQYYSLDLKKGYSNNLSHDGLHR